MKKFIISLYHFAAEWRILCKIPELCSGVSYRYEQIRDEVEIHMEQNTKRKIAVEIAGVGLTLVTDENGAFVDNVVAQVNEKMEAILAGGIRTGTSTLDAALLCAIDSVGERLKAEKR